MPRCSGGRFSAQRKHGRFSIEAASTFAVTLTMRPGLCCSVTGTAPGGQRAEQAVIETSQRIPQPRPCLSLLTEQSERRVT